MEYFRTLFLYRMWAAESRSKYQVSLHSVPSPSSSSRSFASQQSISQRKHLILSHQSYNQVHNLPALVEIAAEQESEERLR